MKRLIASFLIIASISAHSQDFTQQVPEHEIGTIDTVKAIHLVYEDGPVPLQVRGFYTRIYKYPDRPAYISVLNDEPYWHITGNLNNKRKPIKGFIWMSTQHEW